MTDVLMNPHGQHTVEVHGRKVIARCVGGWNAEEAIEDAMQWAESRNF